MKTLTIHARYVLRKTGYRESSGEDEAQYLGIYRESTQYVVTYDGREYRNGHAEHVENPRLRVPFRLVLETRSKADIKRFAERLGRTNAEKWLSALLLDIMDR